MCSDDERKEKMGIIERCEEALSRIEKQGNEIMRKLSKPEVKGDGNHIRATGNGENPEFVNDRVGGITKGDPPGAYSISLVYEKGVLRGLRTSDRTIPPKAITVQVFSNTPLVVLQADGDLQFRGV
jgi:hypothetical protein